MPKWNVSKEILDILNERIPNSWDLHLMSNNPTAEIAAERHENTHLFMMRADRLMKIPVCTKQQIWKLRKTMLRKNCLHGAMSYLGQYLEKLQSFRNGNNRVKRREKTYRRDYGYRSRVKRLCWKNGFNPAFPEDIGRIARLASEHWDKEYLPGYNSEQFSDVARSGTSSNIVNSIIAAREQQQILKDMTKIWISVTEQRLTFPMTVSLWWCLKKKLPNK